MRIGRTLPPATAPISSRDILHGIAGLLKKEAEIFRFEKELKEYFGAKHCFLVSSGKAALTIILRALKKRYPDRDEVLIPAFTCYSVPSAIVRAGLKVRLCDLDPDYPDFDRVQLKKELSATDKLLCVLPVHLFGLPADVPLLRETISDPRITIVEDAAQAMGGKHGVNLLGNLGDVSFFSLGRGKAFSTVEGGVIITRRDDIAQEIRIIMEGVPHYSYREISVLILYAVALSIFSRPSLFWLPQHLPFLKLGATIYDTTFKIRKLSSFQAGSARGWQARLMEFKKIRFDNVQEWLSLLQLDPEKLCWREEDRIPDLIRLPLKMRSAENREMILRQSEQKGLGISRTYPCSIDAVQQLRQLFVGQSFPRAKAHAENLITLPIHPFVSEKDKHEIAAVINAVSV